MDGRHRFIDPLIVGNHPGYREPFHDVGPTIMREQFSGPMGKYRFNFLPPGQYLLEAFRPGFEPFEQPGVPVFPDQWTVINIVMTPGEPGD